MSEVTKKRLLTHDDLIELEDAAKTKNEIIMDYIICFLPIIMSCLAILEYLLMSDVRENAHKERYVYFIGFQALCLFILFIVAMVYKPVFRKLRYKAPFLTFVYILFIIYDYMTLKTGKLLLPYFPWVNSIINAAISDKEYLFDSLLNSLKLLFNGYFLGVFVGLITGVSSGYSRAVNYWVSPFMKLLGAIPTVTWLPIVMVLASTLYSGAVFIIAMGVWFPVSIATYTGINNIDRSYYDAARTLGANNKQLILNIAIPSASPNIFQGLTSGMSSACIALMVAEMVGVESGLGWYITWQKSWAKYANMYAAIVLICLTFIAVNYLLGYVRNRSLKWQDGVGK